MKYDIEKIKSLYDAEPESMKFLFFWGHNNRYNNINKTCLSQWYPCEFEIDGETYNCAEQYMMAQKAVVFKDSRTLEKILESSDPKQIKALGRQVKNFNDGVWFQYAKNIVIRGNYAKFSQNPELKEFLLKTAPNILVEASPYDKIWGIGLSERDHSQIICNPHNWLGTNLLGCALTEVRDMLKAEIED